MLEQKKALANSRMLKNALSAGFRTNLERERDIMLRMRSARSKYETVLEEENYRILEAQSEALSKLAMTKNRYKRIDRVKMALQQVRKFGCRWRC